MANQPTVGRSVLSQKVTDIIEIFKKEQPNITEIGLISNGRFIYKNANIERDEIYYIFSAENIVRSSRDQLKRIDQNINPTKTSCHLGNYNLIIYLIKATTYMIIVYKNDPDNEGYMAGAIVACAIKIKNCLKQGG